jgi:hypothetical protein
MSDNAWTAADKRRMAALTPEQLAQIPSLPVRLIPEGWTAECCTCSQSVTGYTEVFTPGAETPLAVDGVVFGFVKARDQVRRVCQPCGHDGTEAPNGRAFTATPDHVSGVKTVTYQPPDLNRSAPGHH